MASTSTDQALVNPAVGPIANPARAVQDITEEQRPPTQTASASNPAPVTTVVATVAPSNPAPVTTPAATVAPSADDLFLLSLWYGHRTNAPNDSIRQLAQERIDQIMKKIEENSRKAML